MKYDYREAKVYTIELTDSSFDIRFEGCHLAAAVVHIPDKTQPYGCEGTLTVTLYETVGGNIIVHECFKALAAVNYRSDPRSMSSYRQYAQIDGKGRNDQIRRALLTVYPPAAQELSTFLVVRNPKAVKEIP